MFITPDDILLFRPDAIRDQVAALIEDAEAYLAARVPDLRAIPMDSYPTVKAILRSAILRWLDAGDGAITTQSAPGGYSYTVDASRTRRGFFFDDEIAAVAALVPTQESVTRRGRAFTIDMYGGLRRHADGCSWYWGAACDCGLWEPLFHPVDVTVPTIPIPAGTDPTTIDPVT